MASKNEGDVHFGERYLDAMSRIPDPVFVVTTSYNDKMYGFTATSFTSVSSEPPIVSICINNSSMQATAFSKCASLCINLLGSRHHHIANLFSGKSRAVDRFGEASVHEITTGAPALQSSLISFDCEAVSRTIIGTHTVIFGKVVGLEFNPDQSSRDALMYGDRKYMSLSDRSVENVLSIKNASSREAIKSKASYLL